METVIGALFPVTFILALIIERVFPARPLPKVKGWLLKGIGFFVMSGVLGGIVPTLLANSVSAYAPIHLAPWGDWLGGVVAFVVGDIVSYAVHRVLHNVPWLWRWTHQLHHSAERLDVAGASYFHPFDILLQSGGSVLAAGLLGVTPGAAALAGYLGFSAAMFQHMNVRTPRIIGYVIQRPEAHAVHHARGVHAYNYGNLMLWDLLLGTFRNPDGFSEIQGFWDGASSRLGAMLLGRDVNSPPNPTASSTLPTTALNVRA
jgi:sterol desaturase/sphingolipid hydroxylase (fatty acid hydroxylase superfamily)